MQTGATASRGARFADLVMLGALGLYAAIALALGAYYGALPLAAAGSALALGAGALICCLAPGTQVSRITLSLLAMGMVALHIQVARGLLEAHFGVFVTLAVLLVYLDWRPLLAAALGIAIHHLLFDRLQAAGFGVYCITSPSVSRMLLHAGYVILQTSVEAVIAVAISRMARDGHEMESLMQRVGQAGRFDLDVDDLVVTQPRATRLKALLGRVGEVIGVAREASGLIEAASRAIASDSQTLASQTPAARPRRLRVRWRR